VLSLDVEFVELLERKPGLADLTAESRQAIYAEIFRAILNFTPGTQG
jgi:hypothetical protein